jgi:hypothetical protein
MGYWRGCRSRAKWNLIVELSCVDPLKICLSDKGEISYAHDDGREHQTLEIQLGNGSGHSD